MKNEEKLILPIELNKIVGKYSVMQLLQAAQIAIPRQISKVLLRQMLLHISHQLPSLKKLVSYLEQLKFTKVKLSLSVP